MSQVGDGMLRLRLLDDGETVEATGLNYGLRLSALDLTEDQERKLRAGRILKLKSVSTRAGDRRTPDGIPVPPVLEIRSRMDASPERVEKLKALLSPVKPLNVKAVVVSGNKEPLVLNVNSIFRVEPNGDDSARRALGQLGIGSGTSGGGSICFNPSVESASIARNSGPKALWWQEHLAQKKERLRKHAERLLLDDDPESKSYHVGTHFLTILDGVSERRKPAGFESFGFFDHIDEALRSVDEHPVSCLSLVIVDSISGRTFIWHRKGDRWELQDFKVEE